MNFEMRFKDGKKKALTLSYDDGVQQDIRLIGIMDKYGLKGTFNLNSGRFAEEGTQFPAGQVHRRLTQKEAGELYRNSGHEVAVHTLTHPWLEKLPRPVVLQEVLEDRRRLEAMFGGVVRGMAYPFGTYSDAVVEILKAAGIAYSRTVVSTENFAVPEDWLRMPATCHHNNPRLMELAEQFINLQNCGLFYLWGHSYEFEQNDNWQVIENFAAKIGGRDDIWYATNIEIYNYVEAYRHLQFNADCTRAENLSAADVWIGVDGKAVKIAAGQTIDL